MVNDPILLIFDIDGTLTDSGGVTRIALEMAAKELYGVERATKGIAAWGQTDLNIFQLMVNNNDLPVKDLSASFKPFAIRYAEHLETMLFASDKPRLHVGIRDLLDRLIGEPDIRLALGTGNIESTGRLKLRRHGIDHLFPVGGFGSDSSDRPTLLKMALEKSRLHYGHSFPVGSYWVIGDTPNDITSGKRIGADIIAVCTGTYKRAELTSHRPTVVLDDLSNPDYFLALVRREIEPEDGQVNLFEN
jgi:phosphoglycolate phosphatase-like HAD superfamily hydrolase